MASWVLDFLLYNLCFFFCSNECKSSESAPLPDPRSASTTLSFQSLMYCKHMMICQCCVECPGTFNLGCCSLTKYFPFVLSSTHLHADYKIWLDANTSNFACFLYSPHLEKRTKKQRRQRVDTCCLRIFSQISHYTDWPVYSLDIWLP